MKEKTTLRSALALVGSLLIGALLWCAGVLTGVLTLTGIPGAHTDAGELTGLGVFAMLAITALWLTVFTRRSLPILPLVAGLLIVLAGADAFLFLVGVFAAVRLWRLRAAIVVSVVAGVVVAGAVIRDIVRVETRSPLFWAFHPDPTATVFDRASYPSDPETLALMCWLTAAFGVVGLLVSVGGAWLIRWTRRVGALERYATAQREHSAELAAEVVHQTERAQLAQEIHDTLAHRLSVISLHSGALEAAQASDGADSGRVAETAQALRKEAKSSLDDLRALLGDVRTGTAAAPEERSRPPAVASVREIPQLIGSVRAAGIRIEPTVMLTDLDALPTLTDRAVYRIVQESLTNALKHAPGALVTLLVDVSASGARIRVSNPVGAAAADGGSGSGGSRRPGSPASAPSAHSRSEAVDLSDSGSGMGLAGIRERTAILHGACEIGVVDGQFVVDVRLPPLAPPGCCTSSGGCECGLLG